MTDTKQSQFFHIEVYSREGRDDKPSAKFVAAEAMRIPGSCDHVERPQTPTIIYGTGFDKALDDALLRLATEVDSRGRKIRRDKNVFLAGVVSFPHHSERLKDNPAQLERWRKFRSLTVAFLQKKYGSSLASVVEHTDEPYFHLHFAVIDQQQVANTSLLHDGEHEKAKPPKATSQYRYFQALKALQDDFFEQVGQKVGLDRFGPKRQRLTKPEWKARKAVNARISVAQDESKLQLREAQEATQILAASQSSQLVEIEKLKAWQHDLAEWHSDLEGAQDELAVLDQLEKEHPELLEKARRQLQKMQTKPRLVAGT